MAEYEDVLEEQLARLRSLADCCLKLETFSEEHPNENPQDYAEGLGEAFEEVVAVLSALFFEMPERIRPGHDESRAAYVDTLKPAIIQGRGGWTIRWAALEPGFRLQQARLRAAEARLKRIQ